MVVFDIYTHRPLFKLNQKQIIALVVGIIASICIYFTPIGWLIVFTIVTTVAVISKLDKDALLGRVGLDDDGIYLIQNSEEIMFKIKSVNNLSIIYSGYQGKRLRGDIVPKYNSFDGTDNHISFKNNEQLYKFKFHAVTEEDEQDLISLIERWKRKNVEFKELTILV